MSGKAVLSGTAVLVAYFLVRFFVLDVGARTLVSMSSGYGFSIRDTGTLAELFGDAPWKFYLYNVVCSLLTVLFAEPRAGVFQLTAFVVHGEVPLWSVINVVTSTIGTVLIGIYAVRRIRRWRQGPFDHDDGLLLLFVAVLGANAVLGVSLAAARAAAARPEPPAPTTITSYTDSTECSEGFPAFSATLALVIPSKVSCVHATSTVVQRYHPAGAQELL